MLKMKWLYLLLSLAYLISPIDIIPDFFGLPGRLDDIAVFIFVYFKYFYTKKSKKPKDNTIDAEYVVVNKEPNPYTVLELEKGASKEQIVSQYKKLMAQYHPDKVSHLGKELQQVAHEKTLQIQTAFKALS